MRRRSFLGFLAALPFVRRFAVPTEPAIDADLGDYLKEYSTEALGTGTCGSPAPMAKPIPHSRATLWRRGRMAA